MLVEPRKLVSTNYKLPARITCKIGMVGSGLLKSCLLEFTNQNSDIPRNELIVPSCCFMAA